MKIEFPLENKVFLQDNRTNVYPLGNLWSTFNVDLQSNVGVVRISPQMKIAADTNGLANLGCPVAFRWFDSKIWSIAGTRVFSNAGYPADTWSEDGSAGAQTDYSSDESDMEIFNAALCTTTTDALYSKASNGSGTGAWSSRDTLSTGCPHVMTYFKKLNRLYYSDLNDTIRSIDTNWVTADPGSDYAIKLSNNAGGAGTEEYVIVAMDSTNTEVWIGTHIAFDNKNRPGKICTWDGISANISAEYELNNAEGVLAFAIDPKYDTPTVLDTNGVLSAFNGSGFEEIARFPFPFAKLPYNSNSRDNDRAVHCNGMYYTKNGTLRILFNNRPAVTGETVVENMPSGIWEYSKANGLVHIESAGLTGAGSDTASAWGQNRVARVGALESMNIPATSEKQGTLLAGITVYTDATNTLNTIQLDNSTQTMQKRGYIVPDWWESDQIADKWKTWWMTYRRFLSETDNITVKYRNIEEAPVEGAITWVSSTSFTVLNSAVNVSNYWTSGTGGEVEILQGYGSGACVHITNAVNNAGTWTVTIDEGLNISPTDTAVARFQKWIRIYPANQITTPANWAEFAIDSVASEPKIQVKVCFTFTGNGEFYKGILTSNEDIKS